MTVESSPIAVVTPIAKRDRDRQIAYGVVLEPRSDGRPDLQGDWYSDEDIEEAAHSFMAQVAKSAGYGDLMHDNTSRIGYPVESFIAPVDFMLGDQPVLKGSWVMGMHYPDEQVWKRILDGTYSAFSVAGSGVRIGGS